MATTTDICNLALDRIGEPMISDFAENSPNAITCRRHYEAVRDSLLRSHPWNFATGRAQLTADSTDPEFGYSYSYQLPVDCLRELTLNGVEAKKCEASYTIEGRKLLTDASEARITYVKKVEDPNDFDSLFSDVLAFRLAAAIAVSVTGSESKRDGMEQMAALRLNDASFVDANETSPRVLSPLRAGRRSRSNDFRDYGNAPDAGGTWGSITGTLSAQTDLQSALNGKANSLGVDDNYVTDAEKTKLSNLSGTNTGDQDLSGLASRTAPYWVEVVLTAAGADIASGTKVAMLTHMQAGTITGFKIVCDPASEPSASAVEVDLNSIDLSTGAATSRLSAVASIATGANVSTGGTISGTQTVSAGDQSSFDINQGSDGKELRALVQITPS